MNKKYYLLLLGIAIAIQPAIRIAYSCSVPVFRYALERWNPDPYRAAYIYRGTISKSDRAILDKIKSAAETDAPLNLLLQEVNADAFPKEKLTEMLKGPIPDELPALAMWYPREMGKSHPLWIEKPSLSLAQRLVDSPTRKKLARALLNGESVVWIFVPSGNESNDNRAMALLKRELDEAKKAYSKTPFTLASGSGRKVLTYDFSILTLSPKDPAENVFLDLLLKSEEDLYEHTDEPMVFPVFGRGRLLGCLFGDYINEDLIRQTSRFLVGSCSCEIKDQNPGVDLLVAAPWDMVMVNTFVEDTPLPELTGVMPDAAPASETLAADAAQKPFLEETGSPARAMAVSTGLEAPDPETETEGNNGVLKIYGITLGSVLAIVVLAGLVLNHKRKNHS